MPNTFVPKGGFLQATAARAIPPPTLARARAVDAVAAYLQLLKNLPKTRIAIAGNGIGGLAIPDRAKFVYARLGASDGEVAEVRIISLLNPQIDDTLLIRKERPGGLFGWVCIDWFGAGIPPLVFCEVLYSGVWFLYRDAVQFQLLSDFDPTVTNVPNWYSAFDADYDAEFISPSTELEVNVVAQTGNALTLFHSPDRGSTWDLIETVTNDAQANKVRFDESNRDLGFVATWATLSGGEQAELDASAFVPGTGFISYDPADVFYQRNYQPLTLRVTTDGGETYSDFVVEYFGQTYGFYEIIFGSGGALTQGGDPPGDDVAAFYCALHPDFYGVYYPVGGGIAFGFIRCDDAVPNAPTFNGSFCQYVWCAPLHDNANTYLTAGIGVYNPDFYYDDTISVSDITAFTNKLYKVDSTGSILDSFTYETNAFNIVDYFTHIETDRADDSIMYAVTSKVYTFGVSDTQSGKLYRVDWDTHAVTEITPYALPNDLCARALSTSAGTLLVPVTENYLSGTRHLVIWRSTDFGATWSSVDLSDTLGVTYSNYPIVVESIYGGTAGALVIATNDGKACYSLNDGVTWAATSAGLFAGGPTQITKDVGA